MHEVIKICCRKGCNVTRILKTTKIDNEFNRLKIQKDYNLSARIEIRKTKVKLRRLTTLFILDMK